MKIIIILKKLNINYFLFIPYLYILTLNYYKMNSEVQDLINQIYEIKLKIKEANQTINNLNLSLKKRTKINQSDLEDENYFLENEHEINQDSIFKFKEQIKTLESKKKNNEEKILNLKKENEILKKNKKSVNIEKKLEIDNKLKKTSTLKISSLITSLNEGSLETSIESLDKNISKEVLDSILQEKEDYEILFDELKEKCNKIIKTIEDQDKTIKDYKEYLNSINQYIYGSEHNNTIVTGVNVEGSKKNNEKDKLLDEIYDKADLISLAMVELSETNFNYKNNFKNNIEFLLKSLQVKFSNIDKGNYKDKNDLNNLINEIDLKMKEIEKICLKFEDTKKKFNSKNRGIEEKMNKLKKLVKEYNAEYEKKMENNKIIDNITSLEDIDDDEYDELNKLTEINIKVSNNSYVKKDFQVKQSFFLEPKNIKNKLELFKSINLFGNEEIENFNDKDIIIRKNWHEICYVYDNYDFYDLNYDIQAFLKNKDLCFKYTFLPIYLNEYIIEVESLTVNNIPVKYKVLKDKQYIVFNIFLFHKQEAHIHCTYKKYKDPKYLGQDLIEQRQFYRSDYYGLESFLAGRKAKYILILKGSFDIINFKENYLLRNVKNANEIEYVWGGVVPEKGKLCLITFSKKEAIWNFKLNMELLSNKEIKKGGISMNLGFIGGNNEILEMNSTSNFASRLYIDYIEHECIAYYDEKLPEKDNFVIDGIVKNQCKGEWLIEATDKDIDDLMPKKDKEDKEQLKKIAKKIIKDFDEENKDNDFEFLDYMKIGLWVYENIKYDLKYIGKKYSALEI